MGKRSARGISDVVATVIIVAATVAIALVAVAYFTGIVGGSTHTQRVQLTPISRICYNGTSTSNKEWNIVLGVQNTGSRDVTISAIQVGNNYIPLSTSNVLYVYNTTKELTKESYVSSNGAVIPAGKTIILVVNLGSTAIGAYTPGSSYHVDAYISGNVKLLSTDLQAYESCISLGSS